MWATQQNEKCGNIFKQEVNRTKLLIALRHEKNLQKAVWWGRNRDCGWTGPAGAHKNGLTAQYAATMPDKVGPYTRN